MDKMAAKQPDVIAFNGYANQYKDNPIERRKWREGPHVRPRRGPERLERLPRDRHRVRPHRDRGHGRPRRPDHQPRPSQGGWVEFTLEEEGGYPFVNHAFGDMVKGSLGVLKTPNAPEGAGGTTWAATQNVVSLRPAGAPRAPASSLRGRVATLLLDTPRGYC